jgi:hypothetical protein
MTCLSYASNNSRIGEIGHKILIQPIWYPTFSPQKLENTSLGVQKVVQSVCLCANVGKAIRIKKISKSYDTRVVRER